MFNNDSNTSLVMVGSPYRLNHAAHNAYKPSPAVEYNQLDPRLDARPQHGFYHQHRTIEIIELVEVPPPSRQERLSVPASSSCASSSYASSSSCSEEEEEDVAEESYCSSEEESLDEDEEPEPARAPSTSSSFHARMRRIEQWRDAYAKAVGAQLAPSPVRTKRKGDSSTSDEEDETLSRSSKRSRQGSIAGSASTSTSTSSSMRSVHSCSACDAWFPDRGSLHKHGFSPRTNEACRAAVAYDCEQ